MTTLPPLYDQINPDALDAIFRPQTGEPRPTGRIDFPYCGYTVTVQCNGQLTVTVSPDAESEAELSNRH